MSFIPVLLVICSAITGLATEAVKNQFGSKKIPNNILCGGVSVVVSILVSIGYIVLYHIDISPETITSIGALILLNWLCAMTSYDKVIQTISQINKIGR